MGEYLVEVVAVVANMVEAVLVVGADDDQRAAEDHELASGAPRGRVFASSRREAPCCIPGSAGRNSKEGSWVQWLTRIRKVNGTNACQQIGGHAQVSGVARRGTRVIWRRLDCLKPNLQKTQRTVRRKGTCDRRHALRRQTGAADAPSGRGALPSEGNQGDESDAYVTLGRMTGTNAGSTLGACSPRVTECP